MSQTEECESLWTVDDVARYLKTSKSWVYRQAEARKLPHTRLGGLLRFSPDQVRHFAEQQAVRPEGVAKVLPMRGHQPRPVPTTIAPSRGSWYCAGCGQLNSESRVACHHCGLPPKAGA